MVRRDSDELACRLEADDRPESLTPEAADRRELVLCLPADRLPLADVHCSIVGNFSDDSTACRMQWSIDNFIHYGSRRKGMLQTFESAYVREGCVETTCYSAAFAGLILEYSLDPVGSKRGGVGLVMGSPVVLAV